MRTLIIILLLSIAMASCATEQARIRTVIPEQHTAKEMNKIKVESKETFTMIETTLVQHEPLLIKLRSGDKILELIKVDDGNVTIKVDNKVMILTNNRTRDAGDFMITLLGYGHKSILRPKRSFVKAIINGNEKKIGVGERINTGSEQIKLEYIKKNPKLTAFFSSERELIPLVQGSSGTINNQNITVKSIILSNGVEYCDGATVRIEKKRTE